MKKNMFLAYLLKYYSLVPTKFFTRLCALCLVTLNYVLPGRRFSFAYHFLMLDRVGFFVLYHYIWV